MKKIYCLLLSVAFAFTAEAQQEIHSRVAIPLEAQTMPALMQLGVAVDHAETRGNQLVAELSASELQLMRSRGIAYTIEIPDLQRFYAERAAKDLQTIGRQSAGANCGPGSNPIDTVQVPANFNLGTMAGFYKYNEMLQHLDAMAAQYPSLITIKAPIAGHQTIEGRPIYWVKLSDNPAQDESATEPQVLYDAVHHAREPMSMSQTIFYMWYLLENYATNPTVRDVVNNTELFFVPCINPDGYIFNENMNPFGGGMWRKNRRINANGTVGVDLNRNYGFNWAYDDQGSSPDPSTETYRGTAPFSEPETQAMKHFCETHQFKNALNAHSFSNVLIYPYGFAMDIYTPDSARFVEWAKVLTQDNNYVYGTTPQVLGYVANGDSDAWMYGEQSTKPKIFAYTPEVGSQDDGFWPQPSRIVPLAQGTLTQNLHMALLSRQLIRAELPAAAIVSSTSGTLSFTLRNLGLSNGGAVTVALQSSSPLVTSTGAPQTFASLPDLVAVPASIAFTLSTGIAQNTTITMELVITQGSRTWRYPVERTFYSAPAAYSNPFNSLQGTTSNSWGLSFTQFQSASSSVTDSPIGNYNADEQNVLQLTQTINLTNATSAFVKFYAKWDIEASWDYAQVHATGTNGVNQALCGRYTREGTGFFQPVGEPVFDGVQDTWVEELMSLDDFLGQTVTLQFLMASDGFEQRDGIYIDDLEVHVLTTTGISDDMTAAGFSVGHSYPNPANATATVAYEVPSAVTGARLLLHDMLGMNNEFSPRFLRR